ncbi:MAG: CapA family protein [Tannerella sp.]|jgi:cell wall-associated NlpC family hydrolase/poly-gamma-glutamate capsule biosynthesis protein CapA/YwtB (metallophosphatase superfamily)|nr:CapA family protein [Tannerella sp.]
MPFIKDIFNKLFIITFLLAFALKSYTQETKIVSIIGTGDIMLGSNYPSDAKLPPNDGKDLLNHVKPILTDADVTFGNLEGCVLNSGGTPKPCKSGCYFFRMPERYVSRLIDAGFDVMNIANNHMGDFGPAGRSNTVKALKDSGLAFAGLKDVCETAEFEINGVKYGFCGFAPNTGTVKITDIAYAKKIVAALDATCDIVIVSFHGGAEGKAHNRVTRKAESFYGENRGNVYEFAHAVIDAGADVVFGHGPHVVRAAELYKDRFIIYSMGNFCTSGDFNISGISGYAPMVKVYTDTTGVFQYGEIISALQKDKTGPVLDGNHLAAKEIKRLTELDFPQTGLLISGDGQIKRKDDLNQAASRIRSKKYPDLLKSPDLLKVTASLIPKTHLEFAKETPNEDTASLLTAENLACQENKPDSIAFVAEVDSLKVQVAEVDNVIHLGAKKKAEGEDIPSILLAGAANPLAESIIDYSKNFLGKPYLRGSKGPKSFDCSGFTSYIFKQFGYNLSPSCVSQVNQGTRIDKKELKRGDLIFFKGRNAQSLRVGHVGIVISNDGTGNVTFIHACRRGVIIEELNGSDYYKQRYVTGLRVLENTNG